MSWSSSPRAALNAVGLALLVTACGFHLRGSTQFTFSTLYISAPMSPSMAAELTRTIEGSGETKVAEKPTEAQAILDITAVNDDKQVLSLTSGGRVREYALAKRVTFTLHDASGKELLPAGEITIRRSYTYNESEVLARNSEEVRILKEMQTEIVQQIMRRMQTAKLPT